MEIQEDITLGIDLGIASCGWAVIRGGDGAGEIVALGVWMFDAPETDKDRTPTNQLRRQHRGLRRVLSRRRQRMNAIRTLFKKHGLIGNNGKDALKIANLDPWRLRSEALDRKLSGPELAIALGHIGKHRGFKSNSKRDRGANKADDSSKMLSAIDQTRDKLAKYRTVGEMFAKDETFARRKRNRDGEFTRSILRDNQESEVRKLFAAQRRAGNAMATPELEQAFIDEAFFQRPLADSEDKVGSCPFEPSERRAARRSYSFELFRFLTRLAALRIGKEERPLTPQEIATVEAEFGQQKTMTFKTLRRLLDLDTERFANVKPEDEKNDFVARAGAAEGTTALRKAIVEQAGSQAWLALLKTPEMLDQIAFVLSFREDIERIREGIVELGVNADVHSAVMLALSKGKFAEFSKAGNISAKAARNMIPRARQGLVYSDAAKAAGYNHSEENAFERGGLAGAAALRVLLRSNALHDKMGSPVARKAVSEAIKQVIALIEKHGMPGRIHVELAREVGKSQEQREKLKAGQDRRKTAKEKSRSEFESVVGAPLRSDEDLLRYELWKEQNGRCLYSDQCIHPSLIVAGDRTLEVDHILPRGRSGDNSFRNKVLCFASANQMKKGRTPFGWLGADGSKWAKFTACVENVPGLHKQKRRYLFSKLSLLEIEQKFKPRNLNDTQYAARVLLSVLACLYPPGQRGFDVPKFGKPERERRRVFARPGGATNALRRAWGIQDLKKEDDGARLSDDRHHALDALICAATSESALNRLTRKIQQQEDAGLGRDIVQFDPPWPGFVEEVRTKLREIFVARAERRRARGKVHDATIRQIVGSDGKAIIYERKNVEDLDIDDLARIKNPERNANLIESLRAWIEIAKPSDVEALPRSPKGDVIRKVRIESDARPGVNVLRGLKGDKPGSADRTKIVRVDVFENNAAKRRSRYLFVPVYAHQVRGDAPPNRVFTLKTDYNKWPIISPEAAFLFSLNSMCFVEVAWKERGATATTHIEGYFRGIDVNDGRITVSHHRSKDSKAKELQKRLSPTTLAELKKVQVDRLGRRFEVSRETRTWRGVVCT